MESLKKRLILIADDYDEAAALMADLVEWTTPYAATSAKDGQEALERARERLPDIVLLDIDMPRLGGIDAARAMRHEFGERRPFLIAMSGRADLNEVTLTGCFDVVLRKPLDIDGLLRVFDEAIRTDRTR